MLALKPDEGKTLMPFEDRQIREFAVKSGISNGRSTLVPMEKLEDFAAIAVRSKLEEMAKECERFPFGDTAASFAAWIRSKA